MAETATGIVWLAWLDRIPWGMLLLFAAWMAVAPIQPEPHLVEKFRMLREGTLVRPLDIFDLFFHLTPIVLVILKGIRHYSLMKGSGG